MFYYNAQDRSGASLWISFASPALCAPTLPHTYACQYFSYVCATDLPACTLLLAQAPAPLLPALCGCTREQMGTTGTHWLTKSCRTRCTHPSCRGEECASIVRMLCCRSGTCRAAWHQVRHKRRCCSARLRLRADGHDADLLACCIMSRTLYAPKLPPKQMCHHFWAQRAPIQHPSSGNSAAAAPAFTQLSATQQWPTSKHDAAT